MLRPNHSKKPAKQKDVMTNPLKESHYVLFLFIPLAVITVATASEELKAYKNTVTIPLAVIAVATMCSLMVMAI